MIEGKRCKKRENIREKYAARILVWGGVHTVLFSLGGVIPAFENQEILGF